jgi:RNA polymerase sigma-70 factor (ECF subfamily)
MSGKQPDDRLSRIKTRWTTLVRAHSAQKGEAADAQARLLLCYYRAVYCYLCGILRDPDVAEELTHEFSVRFLRGDFKRANPERGRFRDFVKTAARNLALDYWKREARRKKKGPRALPAAKFLQPGAAPEAGAEIDAAFARAWRHSLLVRAWKGLARLQKQIGSPYFTLLRYKSAHPEMRSAQIAKQLGAKLGRKLSPAGVRQALLRAREKFADYLVLEVARSLPASRPDEIERELLELGLFEYCKEALQRLRKRRQRA